MCESTVGKLLCWPGYSRDKHSGLDLGRALQAEQDPGVTKRDGIIARHFRPGRLGSRSPQRGTKVFWRSRGRFKARIPLSIARNSSNHSGLREFCCLASGPSGSLACVVVETKGCCLGPAKLNQSRLRMNRDARSWRKRDGECRRFVER